ncbi:MAG: DUF2264 domain-containing protein [Mediterranea sp.]|jgi:hypothetical protein|nr:DUF2264 domain-containing protein [Mediterranea sp.]
MNDREEWSDILHKIASPVLSQMAAGKLRRNMPMEYSPTWDGRNKQVAYMECFARLMAGIAPWISLPDDDSREGRARRTLRERALRSYANAVDPDSPDFLFWEGEMQPLVDAAYLAHSFLRGYECLWEPLSRETKERYVARFKRLRLVTPPYNNWVLFPALIETFLMVAGEEYEMYRVSLAIHKMEEWYVGDGFYSDGPGFSFDYYNSYVLHPMYVECLETLSEYVGTSYLPLYRQALGRMRRYAYFLERLISPDGYLALGVNGHQPRIVDYYTNTGSLYMASLVFLPLGLPESHPFWTERAERWSSQLVWEGADVSKENK